MPTSANYQQLDRNPYAAAYAAPGRDKGLWSILGRAIRSTVPERRNESYDPAKPTGGENVPYVKPGFFRALAGDRGADFNRAAMLNEDDLDVSGELADKQAGQYRSDVDYDAKTADKLGAAKAFRDRLADFQNNAAAWGRVMAGNANRTSVAEGRNRAIIEAAKLRSGPTNQHPERIELWKQMAREKMLKNAAEEQFQAESAARAARRAEVPQNNAGPGLLQRMFGGGRAAVPQALTNSIPTAPTIPGEIAIDPADLGIPQRSEDEIMAEDLNDDFDF